METELLKILVERTSYINTYWNFYIAVATAILGILASGKVAITNNIRIILTVAFVLFTYSNYGAIKDVNEQRTAILNQISEESQNGTTKPEKKIGNTLQEKLSIVAGKFKPKSKRQYLLFHLLLDITILVSIWRIGS
jgi:hypothetical protein